jgi:hypothetical protein
MMSAEKRKGGKADREKMGERQCKISQLRCTAKTTNIQNLNIQNIIVTKTNRIFECSSEWVFLPPQCPSLSLH